MDLLSYHPGLAAFLLLGFIPSLQGLRKSFGKFTIGHIDGYIISKNWSFINESNCHTYLKLFRAIYYAIVVLPLICLIVWASTMFYTFRNIEYSGILFLLLSGVSGMSIVLGQQMVEVRRYKLTAQAFALFGLSTFCMVIYHMLGNFYYSVQKSFYGVSATFVTYNCLVVIFFIYLNIGKNFVRFHHILDKQLKDELKDYNPHPSYKDLLQCLEEDEHNDMYSLTKKELTTFFTVTDQDTNMFVSSVENKFGYLEKMQQAGLNLITYGAAVLILGVYSTTSLVTDVKKLGAVISILIVACDGMLYLLYLTKILRSIGALSVIAMLFRGLFFMFGVKYWHLGFCLVYVIGGTALLWAKANAQFPFAKTESFLKVFVPAQDKTDFQPADPAICFLVSTGIFAGINLVLRLSRPEGVSLPGVYLGNTEGPFWLMALFAVLFALLVYLVFVCVRMQLISSMTGAAKVVSGFVFNEVGNFWMQLVFAYMAVVFAAVIVCAFSRSFLVVAYAACCPLVAALLYVAARNYAKNNYELLYGFKNEERKAKVHERKQRNIEAIKKKESVYLQSPVIERSGRGKKAVAASPNRVRSLIEQQIMQRKGSIEEAKAESKEELSEAAPLLVGADAWKEGEALMFGAKQKKPRKPSEQIAHPMQKGNWRKDETFFNAFKAGKLHGQDYKLMVSIAAAFISTLLFAFLIEKLCNWTKYPNCWLGVTTAVMIVSSAAIAGSLLNLLTNNISMTTKEQCLFLVGVIIYEAYAIFFYVYREDMNLATNFNNYTLPVYMVVYPMVVFSSLGLYSLYARKQASKACYILWAVSAAHLIVLTLYVYIAFGKYPGNVILTALISVVLSVTIIYAMNRLSLWHDLVLIGSIAAVSGLVLFANSRMQWFPGFLGFSVVYLIVFGSYFVSSLCEHAKAFVNWRVTPTIFYTTLFPSFIYNPGLRHPMSFDATVYMLYLSLGGMIFWSVLLSIFVAPAYYGVVVCTFLVILAFVVTISMITESSEFYALWGKYITEQTIKNAWLLAKEDYIRHQSATCLDELQTFKQNHRIKKRFVEIDSKRDKEQENLNESERAFLELTYLKKLIWLHNADERTHALFKAEVLLLTALEMHVQLEARHAETKEKQDLVNFIKTESEELKAEGIRIDLSSLPSVESKYYSAMSQKSELAGDKQTAFEDLWNKYQQKKLLEAKQHKADEKLVMQSIKSKESVAQSQGSSEAVSRFKDAVKKYKETGRKFADSDFPANDDSLSASLALYVSSWERATEYPNSQIFHGVVDTLDLLQGALGDCYLLSAITVMGERNLRRCFKTSEEEGKAGAFLLKFYRNGEFEEHVLIDDYFPIGNHGEWVFACYENPLEEDKFEMWPMIVEKAYAKFYTSYAKIEGGKVHIALSELTGGIPQYIKMTDSLLEDLDVFFKKLSAFHDNGYLLGAGTPECLPGRPLVNQDMMVQGHAYAILDVRTYAGEMLVKLRNPNGSRGAEWCGEWSDESDNWDDAAIAELQHAEGTDGVFWMNFYDFTEQFKYIYICRKFDGRWTVITLEDSCAGLYTLSGDGMESFPQYEVTVRKPTTIFVKLMQSERLSSYQGKHSIFVAILKNEGKKAYMSDSGKIVSSSLPPINMVSVTAELLVDMFYTFPYTFTVVAGAMDSLSQYSIKFYSTDPQFTVRKMN